MNNSEIINIINQQVTSKVSELSNWKQVRWEGGRLYYEATKIINEISQYNIPTQICYLETLLSKNFIIQDNWPHEAPDITPQFKNWITTEISKLKIKQIEQKDEFLNKDSAEISISQPISNPIQQLPSLKQKIFKYIANHLLQIIFSIIATVVAGYILFRLGWI